MPAGSAHLMLPIVSLAAVPWAFQLVGRTRMLAEAWSQLGLATSFVEPPHSYRSLVRSWLAGTHVEAQPGAEESETRNPQSAISILRPWPPRWPTRFWAHIGERRLRQAMRDRARGLRRSLERRLSIREAAAIVVTPMWLPWLDELPFERIIYDCIDDLAVHAPDPAMHRVYKQWERELIGRCDGAVATACILRDAIREFRPELPVALIRNGVDADWFRASAASAPRPGDLPEGGRRIVGFVGALYEHEDWIAFDLIRRTVEALPEFDFVFVGPHTGGADIAALRSAPNVRLLGRRPYDQVPAYVAGFDVGWVPFKPSRIVLSANPVKSYEYLALGKPVVATPFADPQSFEGLVRIGDSAEEIIELLREAVTTACTDAEARVDFARRNSWRRRAIDFANFTNTLQPPTTGGQATTENRTLNAAH